MTLHTYVGRVLSHAGLRCEKKLQAAIPKRCLVLRDASCDFRDAANRFGETQITWATVYKTITALWLPYLLCSRPNDSDMEWPLVVSLDSREHYVKERDYVQKKRGDTRNKRMYESIEVALTQEKIDLTRFLNTRGGHSKLMELYIQNTDLPLLVLNERHKPVYVVNTTQVPSFLRHQSLHVPPFEHAAEFGAHIRCMRSLVEWPGKGECNKFGYISENDTFLVFVAGLARDIEPDLEVCVVGRDGDYILALLLADLPIQHVWPSTSGNVTWFNIPRLIELIPWGVRPSLAMWLYLTGSDFSDKLVCAPAEAIVSSSLAIFLRVHQIAMDTDSKYTSALQKLVDNMCFVNPFTWELDVSKFLVALKVALDFQYVYYERRAAPRGEDQDGAGSNEGVEDVDAAGGVGEIVCRVAALHLDTLTVVGAMSEYVGQARSLSKGSLKKTIKRTKKQLEQTPDLEEFTQATCDHMRHTIVSAFKAAGHYAQQCLTSLKYDETQLSRSVLTEIFSFA